MTGQVIELFSKKKASWIEVMSYTELLRERDYIRSEIKASRRAYNAACKIDPRGALMPEVNKLLKSVDEFIDGYKFVLDQVQNEMIRRMRAENEMGSRMKISIFKCQLLAYLFEKH